MARGKKRKSFNFQNSADLLKKIQWLTTVYKRGDISGSVYLASYNLLRDQLNSLSGRNSI